jgi:hypothetical protein
MYAQSRAIGSSPSPAPARSCRRRGGARPRTRGRGSPRPGAWRSRPPRRPIGKGGDVDLDPLPDIDRALPVQRQMVSVVLGDQRESEQVGAGPAAGDRVRGCRGWLIASQLRHVNFSRTCSTTFHRRGTHSSVSVTSSPSFLTEPPHSGRHKAPDRRCARAADAPAAAGGRACAPAAKACRSLVGRRSRPRSRPRRPPPRARRAAAPAGR